jgi:hypothetical protein
MLLHGLDQEG